MKEITHIVSWAVPGTILLGSLLFLVLIQKVFMGVSSIYEFQLEEIENTKQEQSKDN